MSVEYKINQSRLWSSPILLLHPPLTIMISDPLLTFPSYTQYTKFFSFCRVYIAFLKKIKREFFHCIMLFGSKNYGYWYVPSHNTNVMEYRNRDLYVLVILIYI